MRGALTGARSRLHSRRLVRAAAAGVAVTALLAPGAASAAPAAPDPAPLLAALVTVKQFPGYAVSEKPSVDKKDTENDDCGLTDPADSTSVSTALGYEKRSGSVQRGVDIEQTIMQLSTASAAKAYYVKTRSAIVSCFTALASKEKGGKFSVSVQRARVVGGATNAYAFVFSSRSTTRAKGSTFVANTVSRSTVYLSGAHLVIVSAGRSTASTEGKSFSVTSTDDAFSRTLAAKAATYSLGALKAGATA